MGKEVLAGSALITLDTREVAGVTSRHARELFEGKP